MGKRPGNGGGEMTCKIPLDPLLILILTSLTPCTRLVEETAIKIRILVSCPVLRVPTTPYIHTYIRADHRTPYSVLVRLRRAPWNLNLNPNIVYSLLITAATA